MSDLFEEPYYWGPKASVRLAETKAEAQLSQVLDEGSKDVVLGAVNRWNGPLREAVRTATALRFSDSSGRIGTAVPVSVVDGIPDPLARVTNHLSAWDWWVVLHRPILSSTEAGLNLLLKNRELLQENLRVVDNRMNAIETVRGLIADIEKHDPEKQIREKLKTIELDIMGAYWFHVPKIQIYWMPLAIFAPIFRVPLATLATVVLCHELVHAYTHRGIDLNRGSWDTRRFQQTTLHVVEGLAQFYTEQVMRGLGNRLPDGLSTFEAKTKNQAPAYNAYKDWIAKDKQPSPEAARYAMIEYRVAEPADYSHEGFIKRLRAVQDSLVGEK